MLRWGMRIVVGVVFIVMGVFLAWHTPKLLARTRQKWERQRWLTSVHWPSGFSVWGFTVWLGIAVLMLLTIGFTLIFNPSFVLDGY